MGSERQVEFARAVVLGQKIHLNCQAMLTMLSRSSSGGVAMRRDLKEKFRGSLLDLGSCFEEFEGITGIDLSTAQGSLGLCLDAFEKDDTQGLYETLQKLYREDYLGKIIELAS
jgi:hypothetical protein